MSKKGIKKDEKNLTWETAYVVKKFFAYFATFRKQICDFSLRPCGGTDAWEEESSSIKKTFFSFRHPDRRKKEVLSRKVLLFSITSFLVPVNRGQETSSILLKKACGEFARTVLQYDEANQR